MNHYDNTEVLFSSVNVSFADEFTQVLDYNALPVLRFLQEGIHLAAGDPAQLPAFRSSTRDINTGLINLQESVQHIFLNVQYRQPAILNVFPSAFFYEGRVKSIVEEETKVAPKFFWVVWTGPLPDQERCSTPEAKIVYYMENAISKLSGSTVLCFYSAQRKELLRVDCAAKKYTLLIDLKAASSINRQFFQQEGMMGKSAFWVTGVGCVWPSHVRPNVLS